VRNFHQGFHNGVWMGMIHAAFQQISGGRGLVDPMPAHAGHEVYYQLDGTSQGNAERFKGDGKLTFDRLTDVFHSGTRHEEDQPCHLNILEPDICISRCTKEYGNPCEYFCPAAVYEMANENGKLKLKINASNCVHCKTCDIMDPYQIINWVVPEGGGGPNYEGM
jgi:electron-transferring-flavoprotein dehydrogenase